MITALELKKLFEKHLSGYKFSEKKPSALYEPLDYILSLNGKRIRPILTLLTFQSIKGTQVENALNLATAVECFHNFTLIHDDIMDNAPVRRGHPTVHLKWNPNTAILSGDALFALTFSMLVKDFPDHAYELSTEYSEISALVCEGQMEDMELSNREAVLVEEYIEMIRKKTAVLLGGCMKLAAISANAGPGLQEKLYRYGEMLGIGFQLQDDLLDVYAEEEKFGKQVGGDILENKKTYPFLKAFELADPTQTGALNYLFKQENDPSRKISGVVQIYNALNVRTETEKKIAEYFGSSEQLEKEILTESEINPSAFALLRQYLQAITDRKF